MGIKAILESVDDLPDEVKGFYAQDGDNFVLDIDGIDDHPKVRGVITANKTNKETRDRFRAELDQLKGRYSWLPDDFDADAFESLKEAAMGKGGQPSEEQVQAIRDKVREKIEGKFSSEVATRDETIAKLQGALQRITIDEGLSKAADEANIDTAFKDAAIALIQRSAKITVDEDGDTFKASVDTDMGPVSLSQFVRDWAGTEHGKKFVAKPTGPALRGGTGKGSVQTITRSEFNKLHPLQQRKMITQDKVQVVDQ